MGGRREDDEETAFSPWAPVFWLETPDGEQADEEERLAACEALVEAYPEFLAGHDRHAETLASMGRYDEARGRVLARRLGGAALPRHAPRPAAWVEARAATGRRPSR